MSLQKSIGNQAVQRLVRSGNLDLLEALDTAGIDASLSELSSTALPEIATTTTSSEAESNTQDIVSPPILTSSVIGGQARVENEPAEAAAEAASAESATSANMKGGETSGVPAANTALPEKAAPAEGIAAPSKKVVEERGKGGPKEAGEAPDVGEAATVTPPMEKGGPPEAMTDKAPESAKEDLAFKAVIENAESVGRQQKRHPSAKRKAQEAKVAADPPPNEATSKGKADKVENMDAEADKPHKLDAASFKIALKEALEKQLKGVEIKSEEDAKKFKEEDPATKIKDNVVGMVKEHKDAAQAPIRDATGAKLKVPSQEEPPELVSPQAGAPPRNIEAHKAVPKPKTDAEISLEEDSNKLDQQMTDADVTEEQLELSNEPDFQGALSEKREAQTQAKEAPLAYRQDEQVLLADAKTDAVSSSGSLIQSIYGTRKNQFKQTGNVLENSKTENEKRRGEVSGRIESIYKQTEEEVNRRLGGLDKEVNDIFENAAAEGKRKFEEKVKIVSEYYSGVGGAIIGAGEAVSEFFGGEGEPAWVGETFKRGKELYVEELENAVGEIARVVELRLTETKNYIDTQWKEIQKELDKVTDPALQEFVKEATKKMESRFNTLKQSVDEKFDQIVDSLASKYADNLKKLDERIEELKKQKGFLVAAGRAIGDAIKTIGELKDMIVNVLAKAARVIGKIIKHPITFLENLVKGVKKGLSNFTENIGMHLERGLVTWLFGELGETGIQMPDAFDPMGVFSLVLQVLGLTYSNVRARAAKLLGQDMVGKLEQGAEIFKILYAQGPMGLWEYIKDKVSELKEMVVEGIKSYIKERVIIAGIEWVVSLLIPFAGFIKAAKGIYNIIKFFVTNIDRIIDLVNAILDSIEAIADGAIDVAAKMVEDALAKAVPIAIGFLAALLNLGGIGKAIRGIIKRVQDPVNEVIDWLIQKAVGLVKAAGKLFGIGKKEEKAKEIKDPKLKATVDIGKRVSWNAGDESHEMWIEVVGKNATVMMASKDAGEVLVLLGSYESRANKLKSKSEKERKTKILRHINDARFTLKSLNQKADEEAKLVTNPDVNPAKVENLETQVESAEDLVWPDLQAIQIAFEDVEIPPTKVHPTGGSKASIVTAMPLTKIPGKPGGSPPSEDPPGWDHVFRVDRELLNPKTEQFGPRFWRRMHLLSEMLHGPGKAWNLVPAVEKDNSAMKNGPEADAKERIEDDEVLYYRVDVDFYSGKILEDFPSSVNVDYGSMYLKDGIWVKADQLGSLELHPSKPPLKSTSKISVNSLGRDTLWKMGLPYGLAESIAAEAPYADQAELRSKMKARYGSLSRPVDFNEIYWPTVREFIRDNDLTF